MHCVATCRGVRGQLLGGSCDWNWEGISWVATSSARRPKLPSWLREHLSEVSEALLPDNVAAIEAGAAAAGGRKPAAARARSDPATGYAKAVAAADQAMAALLQMRSARPAC